MFVRASNARTATNLLSQSRCQAATCSEALACLERSFALVSMKRQTADVPLGGWVLLAGTGMLVAGRMAVHPDRGAGLAQVIQAWALAAWWVFACHGVPVVASGEPCR